MSNSLNALRLECNRCGASWLRRTEALPRQCPRCKTVYWNKPRVRAAGGGRRKKRTANETRATAQGTRTLGEGLARETRRERSTPSSHAGNRRAAQTRTKKGK